MSTDWTSLYPFADHFLPVDGGRLHYVDEGPRDAPVLLFVHGNPTWSFYWRAAILAFRDRFRCVAMDHIGCGRSDKPQDWPYHLEGHIQNVLALARHLDLQHITLVVHDWGGAIGCGAGVRMPERIDRLVITNTAAFPFGPIPTRIAVGRIPGVGPLVIRGFNGFAGLAVHMASEKGLKKEVAAGLTAPYDSWANRIATLRFVQDIPMDASHPSYAALSRTGEQLSTFVDRPVLIVWGEEDWCFTPAFRREWERRFPAARSVPLKGIGHYVMEDAPEEVVKQMESFLR